MLYFLEHAAIAVAAVSGVLAARGKRIDLFGVAVLGLVTALGGGTIRDVVLDLRPVFWVGDPWFLLTAFTCAIATFLLEGLLIGVPPLAGSLLQWADAGSLALVTMIGTEKTLAAGFSPAIAVTMGVLTGTAGGIIRDMMLGEIPMVFRQEIYLYATASLAGSVLYIVLSGLVSASTAALSSVALVFGLRLAAIWNRWRLPNLRSGVGHDG
jgi:uncharacterized membrane protein YeiH